MISKIDKINKKKTRKLRICKAKYEISFDDLYEVQMEYTTMQDIQEILLRELGGIIYLNWNGIIIE